MTLNLRRYLSASEFARELGTLRAYRDEYVSDNLLEGLEEARLVVPKLRMRWPDTVARRFWLNARDGYVLHAPIEPDGPLLDAAKALDNALHRWNNHTVYGLSKHPFDDLDSRFTDFVTRPGASPFVPWRDMRIDVSNNHHSPLYAENVESYYSSWQVLLAAEVADFGVSFRINLAEEETFRNAHEAIRASRMPGGHARLRLAPGYVVKDFKRNERALDAVVWYEEESDRALMEITKDQGGGRFRLDEAQSARFWEAKNEAVETSANHHEVGVDNLIETCRFLASRWASWNRDGRPLIASAYKDFLSAAVVMTRRLGNLSYSQIRERVGQQGGWFEPILDVIWPDWTAQEKERVRRTLRGWIAKNAAAGLSELDLNAFVDFLESAHLEAFFWRLRSFEEHSFSDNDFALEGMKSDLEGMAVVVEQALRALGANGDQLYELFKDLWKDSAVAAVLKRNNVSQLARNKKLIEDWPRLKAQFRTLRGEGESSAIAADLAMAHRIRGGVHQTFPETDQFELEQAFVALMRAAALTFAEVMRNRA